MTPVFFYLCGTGW